jgi:serine/threonine protein kinase
MDNLYREPKDGMISLRKNNGSEVVIDKNPVMEEGIPEIELVTLIDLSTLWEDKQQLAGDIAQQICCLNHPNLLNITRNLRYLDNSEM